MSLLDFIYTFMLSFSALFPVINPIGTGFMLNGFLDNLKKHQRKTAIKNIFINCLLVGIGSLVAGHFILLLFDLAIPVIQLAGGILICMIGLEWLSRSEPDNSEKEELEDEVGWRELKRKIFYPMSFPISIGPGSMSVIFTLMATAKGSILNTAMSYCVIALVIVIQCAMLCLFLWKGDQIIKRIGNSGSLIINKLVAFFTFCIGIQIIITGVSKIFHIDVL